MKLTIIATFKTDEELHKAFPNNRHYDGKEIFEKY